MISGDPSTEITSAFRRYQFDIETEIMMAAKLRAKAKGQTFRIYLRELIRADLLETTSGSEKETGGSAKVRAAPRKRT